MKTKDCVIWVFNIALIALLMPSASAASGDYIKITFDDDELQDDTVTGDDYTQGTFATSGYDDTSVNALNSSAVLRFDGNSNSYLNDTEDGDLYNSIIMIDQLGGEIQFAYNLTEHSTYSNGNGNLDAGEVVTIKGSNYVITDNVTSDQDIELGPAIIKTLSATTVDKDFATVITGTKKMLLSTSGYLYFYDGGNLVDGPVSLSDITTYPYKLTYTDIYSDEFRPYNIYVVANTSTTANITVVEKSQLFKLSNDEESVMGYTSIKINDTEWFTGGTTGVFLLGSSITLIKGETIDLPDTYYMLKYTPDKKFDIKRREVSTVTSGTELNTTTTPGKEFLKEKITMAIVGGDIYIEYGLDELHDSSTPTNTYTQSTFIEAGYANASVNAMNATLKYDGNADGDLKDDPDDYDLYNHIVIIDQANGDIQFAYNLSEYNTDYYNYSNVDGNLNVGEVVKIKGTKYVVTENETSDNDFELGPSAFAKSLPSTTVDKDNAIRVSGEKKILYGNDSALYFYYNGTIVDGPVNLSGITQFPHKLTPADVNSSNFSIYNIYVLQHTDGISAMVTMVEKSQLFNLTNDQTNNVLGYSKVKIDDADWFTGGTSGIYLLSDVISLVKGDTIDLADTYYQLKYTSSKQFDIERKKTYTVVSGATLKGNIAPGKDFLKTPQHRIIVQVLSNVDLSRPDLTVSSTDITFSDSTPKQGDEILIYAKARNLGALTSDTFTLSFYVDNTLISQEEANVNQIVNAMWISSNGTHEIKVVVDENNAINETDENNNFATKNITLNWGSVKIEYGLDELHDDAIQEDDYTLSTLAEAGYTNWSVNALNTSAILRYDGNSDGDLKDDPDDYDLYTSIVIIDAANGDIQFAYNLSEHATYSDGDGAIDEGEVVTIKGNKYVVTDNETSDQNISLGLAAFAKMLAATTADPDYAITISGTKKVLYSNTGALYFYVGADLTDGPVNLSGISSYPYKLTAADINSSEFRPYNIYVISNTTSTAMVTMVEKSLVQNITNDDEGVLGYSSVKIDDTDWFTGGTTGVYFLDDAISLVKGETINLADTDYQLKYTSSKQFDIERKKTSIVDSGAELKIYTDPGKDFLTRPVTFTPISAFDIDIEYGLDELHDDVTRTDDFTQSIFYSAGYADASVNALNTSAVLRFDGNADSDLKDDPEDYDLYNSIVIVDATNGDIQFAYNLTEHAIYSNGDGNINAGEVVAIKGTNYVITDDDTSDQNFELGPALFAKQLTNTTVNESNAIVITGTKKVLYGNGALYFYFDGALYELPVSLSNITQYPYKLTSTEITSDEFKPYNIYVISNTTTTAMITMVEKSQTTKYFNDEGVFGYSQVKINDTEWFTDSGIYLLSDYITLVKGSKVDLPDTYYQLKWTAAKQFDILRKKTSTIASGTKLKTTTSPGKDFLARNIEISVYVPQVTAPAPVITIVSPANTTYNTSTVDLKVSADETINTWWYSLNGGSNTIFHPNTTIKGRIDSNKLIVRAMDVTGNTHSSTVYFTLSKSEESDVRNVTKDNLTYIDFKNESKVVIEFMPNANATLNITADVSTNATLLSITDITAAYGLAQNQKSLGRFIQINVSGIANNESGIKWVVLKMYYDESDLDKNGDGKLGAGDINENALKMYWYCDNCSGNQKWFPLTSGSGLVPKGGPEVFGTGYNTTENYYWVNLSHFSAYCIAGDTVSGSSTTTGGGGPPPITKVNAVLGRVEITIPLLYPGVTKVVEIPEARNVYISNLAITVNKRVYNVKITVTTLSSRSEDVKDVGGEIYHYNVVDLQNINDEDINNVTIGFKVRQTWVTNKNIDSDKVLMNRYHNGSWSKLLTAKKSNDSNYIHYSAISPGF